MIYLGLVKRACQTNILKVLLEPVVYVYVIYCKRLLQCFWFGR